LATPEKNLTNEIRLICGQNNILAFDVNTGGGELVRGGYFRSGLPRGFPDLLIFYGKGKVAFLEAKIKPNRPSKEQLDFIKYMKNRGYLAGVVWSVDDFLTNYLPLLKVIEKPCKP